MHTLMSFVAGLVFGFGLLLSGMSNPAKVQGFLDLAGHWDPSLALVMGGAILVGLFAFRAAHLRVRTLLGGVMRLPVPHDLSKPLVLGSLAFGVGWGLAGFCPGPALVSLGTGEIKAVVFVAAMLGGMLVFDLIERIGGPLPAPAE